MTQSERILELLEERGDKGATNLELNQVCFRYGARLHDLKKQGYVIRSQHIKDSLWKFVLDDPVEKAAKIERMANRISPQANQPITANDMLQNLRLF